MVDDLLIKAQDFSDYGVESCGEVLEFVAAAGFGYDRKEAVGVKFKKWSPPIGALKGNGHRLLPSAMIAELHVGPTGIGPRLCHRYG